MALRKKLNEKVADVETSSPRKLLSDCSQLMASKLFRAQASLNVFKLKRLIGHQCSGMLRSTLVFLPIFYLTNTAASTWTEEFSIVNDELKDFNSLTADLYWQLSINGNSSVEKDIEQVNQLKIAWKTLKCRKFLKLLKEAPNADKLSVRAVRLLCNGPTYTYQEARDVSRLIGKLRRMYNEGSVCINNECMKIEPDLMRFMAKNRDPELLKSAWSKWREIVGPPSRDIYERLVVLMNEAAQRSGYADIGSCWREEIEIENLEEEVLKLLQEISPLYRELHAVVRFRLREYYGENYISSHGPIPAHLLGDMWGQTWVHLLDIVYDRPIANSLTEILKLKNYTVWDMVRQAENTYVSLGFPPLPKLFWKKSSITKNNGTCHGTAANMFKTDDYRMLLCACVTEEDFHIIHHELGHIQYFMAYQKLPTIFQDGTNSAMQESIGEAIMMVANSPGHLQTLGFSLNEKGQLENSIEHLLKFALDLLPQIPFALVMDKWRWDVFKRDISAKNYNNAWWYLRKQYQGIEPPVERTETHFDPASKFHIVDNTPYIRYFLASIFQFQLYEAMCNGSTFEDTYSQQKTNIPLHECNIDEVKHATDSLRLMMSKGRMIDWDEAVLLATGSHFQSRALLKYFEPLRSWLQNQIYVNNIPIGWN